MALARNTKLGRYEIERSLGVGGMGEVYLARDASLNRKVAIKLLPAEVGQNRDRLRRFEQEALAVAALNHPNIAHIYEIAETDAGRFIAMEFIDGVTLAHKIHREKAPLKKLLKYLVHSADALAKAHAAGIVHRDLKPDNIMVTVDDHAKVLDFGLAKLVEPKSALNQGKTASQESATAILEQPLSTPGMIMGTVGYMSPEQAQGRGDVDQRSDVFSFGCILFEAATGKRAFEGTDQLDTLHKIVHSPTPRITDSFPQAPPDLQRIVRRCLAKDPEERFHSIKDVAIELRELRREMDGTALHLSSGSDVVSRISTGGGATDSATAGSSASSTAELRSGTQNPSSAEFVIGSIKGHKAAAALLVSILIVAGLAAVYGAYRFFGLDENREPSSSTMKVSRLTSTGKVTRASISPDGRYAAHVVEDASGRSVWVRQIATGSDINIAPASRDEYWGLAFSKDGNYVYYVRREGAGAKGTVFQVPTLGGPSKKIVDGSDSSITLSPDGKQMAFYRFAYDQGASAVVIANVDGSGERTLVTRREPTGFDTGIAWSPDGKVIACAGFEGGTSDAVKLVAVSVDNGTISDIDPKLYGSILRITWLEDGESLLISAADRITGYFYQIWEIPYSGGPARRVTNDLSNYSELSVTTDGKSLLTVQGDWVSNLWIAPNGDSTKAQRISTGKYDGGMGVAWVPGGRIVHGTRDWDIYILNADGTNQQLLTKDEHNNRWPAVTPDGRYIVFESWRSSQNDASIWRIDIDGGNPKPLTTKGSSSVPRVSPDGKWVVYESLASGKLSIWKTPIDGGDAVPVSDILADEPAISPDGKLIACFYYPEGQTAKIAVLPFEGGQPVHIFDVDKSVRDKTPGWSPDGSAVIYILDVGGVQNLFAQPLSGGPPKQLTYFKEGRVFAFDWSRDGKQLLLSRGDISNDVVLINDFR